MTTAETVTARQIRTLRTEAVARGAGYHDYNVRARAVASGAEGPTWAWPPGDVADCYADGSVASICEELGIPESAWPEAIDDWRRGFLVGYREAHDGSI